MVAKEQTTTAAEPFLASLKDTAAKIEELRAQQADIERQQTALDARKNYIANMIPTLNALRQAHGLPPV